VDRVGGNGDVVSQVQGDSIWPRCRASCCSRYRLAFASFSGATDMSVENVNLGESLFMPYFSSRDTLSAHYAVSLTESDVFSLLCTASNDMTNKFPEKYS